MYHPVKATPRGGPPNDTKSIVFYMCKSAYKNLEFGYGSSVAYGLFAITLLITIAVVLYSRRTKVEAF